MKYKYYLGMVAIVIVGSIPIVLGQQTFDTVLYNGKVLTVDSNFSTAEAVAVSGNRIVSVGNNDEVLGTAGPNTLRIDLKGKTLVPGFINTHVHLESVGAYTRELGTRKSRRFPLNVRGMKSKDEVLQHIQDVIAAFKFEPGEWIFFAPNWTASQANRSALDEDVIEATKVSESYQKIMTADFVMSLSRKVEDKIGNTGRFHVIKNRFGPDGLTFPAKVNTNTCLLYTSDAADE